MPTEQGYIRHFRSACRRENYIKCMKNTSRVLDTEVSDWAEGFMHKVMKVRQL